MPQLLSMPPTASLMQMLDDYGLQLDTASVQPAMHRPKPGPNSRSHCARIAPCALRNLCLWSEKCLGRTREATRSTESGTIHDSLRIITVRGLQLDENHECIVDRLLPLA